MKNMGSLGGIMKLIPGMAGKISDDQLQQGEAQLRRVEAMINSMTKQERKDPELLSGSPSRRRRIAKGSGYQDKDVSKLVSDFQKMRTMMQQMGSGQMGFPGMGGGMPGMGGQPGFRGYPGAMGGGAKKKKANKKKKGFGEL